MGNTTFFIMPRRKVHNFDDFLSHWIIPYAARHGVS